MSSVSCLLSHVSCLRSSVSCILSHGSRVTAPVSRLLSLISCLTSPISLLLSHISCLTSPVLKLLSQVSCLTSHYILRVLTLTNYSQWVGNAVGKVVRSNAGVQGSSPGQAIYFFHTTCPQLMPLKMGSKYHNFPQLRPERVPNAKIVRNKHLKEIYCKIPKGSTINAWKCATNNKTD